MAPLPSKEKLSTVNFSFRYLFSLSNILLLYIVMMGAACLIRYKKMILSELGFFSFSFLDISSFGQDLHSHPMASHQH